MRGVILAKWKDITYFWRWRNEIKTTNPGTNLDDTPLGWNVYVQPNMTRKQFAKEFYKVHGRFKYRLIMPGLVIAREFFLPKYKHEGEIEKNAYNREWVVFERSFNLAIEDMAIMLFYNQHKMEGRTTEEVIKLVRNDDKYMEWLKTMKQMVMYVSKMDTAYHEFGAFLMHRIAQEMQKEFDGETYNRVIYNSKRINDVHWFIITQMLQNQVKGGIDVDVKEIKPGDKYEWENKEDKRTEGTSTKTE